MKKYPYILYIVFFVLAVALPRVQAEVSISKDTGTAKTADPALKAHIDFFEKVFKTMQENYYQPVSREGFDRFVNNFRTKIYDQLKGEGKSSNYVRWRATAYLVEGLKSPEDRFSAFLPPQPAKEFEQKALGQRIDLGIEGHLTKEGYKITRLEPRSNAYEQGLKENDILLKIDDRILKNLSQKQIDDLLNLLVNATVKVEYICAADGQKKTVQLTSQEYFKQTVFLVPLKAPGVFCLQIQSFNRKTSEDMFRYLSLIEQQGASGLIIDLRGNPGGPPLAAREISSFFLNPGEDFAYFQKTGQEKALLDVPTIPEQYRYKGPVVILVNKESGSATELFSGVMQRRGRAILLGTNTAGQVVLKSMFHFDDESMLYLVTSRAHYPDGSLFSFDGVVPDHIVDNPKEDLLNYAVNVVLLLVKNQSQKLPAGK